MSVEFDPTRPIYLQIIEAIKKGIIRTWKESPRPNEPALP